MRPNFEEHAGRNIYAPLTSCSCESPSSARRALGSLVAIVVGVLATMTIVGFSSTAVHADEPPNILFVVIDDWGTDRFGLTTDYDPSSPYAPPPTPNIDALAANGVLFRNAYANPTCSPTRALLLTGRYAFRTGIGDALAPQNESMGLKVEETILPEVLGRSGYATGLFGKWHLGDSCELATGSPSDQGFDRFFGIRGNIASPGHYRDWLHIDNPAGTCDQQETRHATEAVVEEALDWIDDQSQRWFCMVSFSAVHTPLQLPSAPTPPSGGGVQAPLLPVLDAMIEHTDANIGTLLAGIDLDETMVFLMGDNGTATDASGVGQTVFPPYDPSHAKGSVYEQGVRVPLIASGPLVAGSLPVVSDALVSLVDLFRTVTELTGIAVPTYVAEDSVSFAEILDDTGSGSRSAVYCELFGPNHPQGPGGTTRHYRSLRNAQYKLVRDEDGANSVEEFYDLLADPLETNDLLPVLDPTLHAHYQALVTEMNAIPLP